jgi:hypothetical protein
LETLLIYSLTRLILLFLSYEGAFDNGDWHGQGIRTLASGRVFTGVFNHNELVQGIETFSDGYRFFSPFKDSIPSINLSCEFNFFLRYEGAFENDRAHGQGIETLANGYRFFSPFKDSIPSINLSCEFNFFF